VPIDLGDEESGHAQPKPSHVSVEEFIEVVSLPQPPEETVSDEYEWACCSARGMPCTSLGLPSWQCGPERKL
jgi:hypothetical protein